MLIVYLLVSVIVIEVGNNEGTELGFWEGKVLGTTNITIDVFSLSTYYGTELVSTDGTVYGIF